MAWGRVGAVGARRRGAAAATALLLAAAACGADDDGDGGAQGASGGGPAAGARAAGPVLLLEEDAMVAVGPDGEGRREVEGAPGLREDTPVVTALGTPGTAVTADGDGGLVLLRADEGRAVELGVALDDGPAVSGPSVALGGGDRFTLVASPQNAGPVLVDAEEGVATPLADIVGADGPLVVNRFSPDEGHLAVEARDGVHVVATEEATDLGVVGDRNGGFAPDGATFWASRAGGGGARELVRVGVDDVGDADAVEVVAEGRGMIVLAVFADGALVLDGEDAVLVGTDGDATPVGLRGMATGSVLAGAEQALVRVEADGDGDAWALVDASGAVEPLPELDGFTPIGGGPGSVVLGDGMPGDDIGTVAVARIDGAGVEVAAAPLDPPDGTDLGPTLVPSPDGRWVAAVAFGRDEMTALLVDTGTGESTTVDGAFRAWSPASDAVLVSRPGPGTRLPTALAVTVPDATEADLGEGLPLAWTAG